MVLPVPELIFFAKSSIFLIRVSKEKQDMKWIRKKKEKVNIVRFAI